MNYYFVTHSIDDGTYEYHRHSVVEAPTPEAATEAATAADREWVGDDHREVSPVSVEQVSRTSYNVLRRYVRVVEGEVAHNG